MKSLDNRRNDGFSLQSLATMAAYAVLLLYFAAILMSQAIHGSESFMPAEEAGGSAVSVLIAWPVRLFGLPASYTVLMLLLAAMAWPVKGTREDGSGRRAIGLFLLAFGIAAFAGVVTGAHDMTPGAGRIGAYLAVALLALSKPVALILSLALTAFAVVVARDWFFYKALRRGAEPTESVVSVGASAPIALGSFAGGNGDGDYIRPLSRKGASMTGSSSSNATASLLDIEPLEARVPATRIESAPGESLAPAADLPEIDFSESWEPVSSRQSAARFVDTAPREDAPAVETPAATVAMRLPEVTIETPAESAGDLDLEDEPTFAGLNADMLSTKIDLDDDPVFFDGEETETMTATLPSEPKASMGEDDMGEMEEEEMETEFEEEFTEEEGEDDEEADEDDEDFDADADEDDEDLDFEDEEFDDEDEDSDDDEDDLEYGDQDIDEDLFAEAAPLTETAAEETAAPVETTVEHMPHRTLETVATDTAPAPVAATPVFEEPPLWSAVAAANREAEPVAGAPKSAKAADWAAWMDEAPKAKAGPAPVAAPAPKAAAAAAKSTLISDATYEAAVRVVLERDQCSLSLLQRQLRMSFADAASAIERMEQEGVVGPYRGSGNREILQSLASWESRKG